MRKMRKIQIRKAEKITVVAIMILKIIALVVKVKLQQIRCDVY